MKGRFGPPRNGTLPATCAANATAGLTPIDGRLLKGLAYKNESGVTAGECCSRCASEVWRKWFPCKGYSFVPSAVTTTTSSSTGEALTAAGPAVADPTGTCARFAIAWGFEESPAAQSAYAMPGGYSPTDPVGKILHSLGKLGSLLGGNWYSTQAAGECKSATAVIGTDCWWRLHSVERLVNSSCVNGRLITTVIAARPKCFASCPQPTNRSSVCWVGCLYETLVGNSSSVPPVPSMQRKTLIDAFEGAFDEESEGGCPVVPPCPPPCKPPPLAHVAADEAGGLGVGAAAGMMRPNLPFGWW